jgi:phosphoglycolate phosphatase-like HAD superfamily hydrolase
MSVDVQTARGAGVAVWAVATGSETEQEIRASGPDQLFGNMKELHARLLSQGFEPSTK